MNDSSKFGMAKSFFMKGQEAGFDMTNEKDMNRFMKTYNAKTAAENPELREGIDLYENEEDLNGPKLSSSQQKKQSAKKKKARKTAKASRKKNRKKRK